MNQSDILYPVFLLLVLTFGMMFAMLYFRVMAVKKGLLRPWYFKLNRGGEEPPRLAAVTQNFDNLLALPMLFYIAVVLLIALKMVTPTFIYLAWAYVVLRYIHSFIHTSYNHVLHRLFVFATSVAVLIAIWIRIALQVSSI